MTLLSLSILIVAVTENALTQPLFFQRLDLRCDTYRRKHADAHIDIHGGTFRSSITISAPAQCKANIQLLRMASRIHLTAATPST